MEKTVSDGDTAKLKLLKTSTNLIRELGSHVTGCQSQMKYFKFLDDMHFAYKLCLTNGTLRKNLHRESISAIE